jgi:folate-binding protein YgfZ
MVWIGVSDPLAMESVLNKLDELDVQDFCFDPRNPRLGIRVIASQDAEIPQEFLELQRSGGYERHRLALGVPEHDQDLISDKSLPLECNLHWLNGISFSKGCYLGQELTARTHFKGVIRKRIIPFTLASQSSSRNLFSDLWFPHLPSSADLQAIQFDDKQVSVMDHEDKDVGSITSFCHSSGFGLAMLRLDSVFARTPLRAGSACIRPWIPSWFQLFPPL